MPLFTEVQPGDALRIGDITIAVEKKTGQRTRLRIDGAPDVQHIKAGSTPAMKQPEQQQVRNAPPASPAAADGPRPLLQMPSFLPA